MEILGASGNSVDNGHGWCLGGNDGQKGRCQFTLDVVDGVVQEAGGRCAGVRLEQFTIEPYEHMQSLAGVKCLFTEDPGALSACSSLRIPLEH